MEFIQYASEDEIDDQTTTCHHRVVEPILDDLYYIASQYEQGLIDVKRTSQSNNLVQLHGIVKIESTNNDVNGDSDDSDESDNDIVESTCKNNSSIVQDSDISVSSDDENEKITNTKKISKATYRKNKVDLLTLTEEEEDNGPNGPIKSKNEIMDEHIPSVKDITGGDGQEELHLIGKVLYCIEEERTVVVQSDYTESPLHENSVLCNMHGLVLGRINEIFGPVTKPYYAVRWKAQNNDMVINKDDMMDAESIQSNNNPPTIISAVIQCKNDPTEEVIRINFSPNVPVYGIRRYCSFVTPGTMLNMKLKGSDASNVYDEELPEEEMEYSDDEKELLAKQKLKNPSKVFGIAQRNNDKSFKRKPLMQSPVHVPINQPTEMMYHHNPVQYPPFPYTYQPVTYPSMVNLSPVGPPPGYFPPMQYSFPGPSPPMHPYLQQHVTSNQTLQYTYKPIQYNANILPNISMMPPNSNSNK